MKLNPLEQLKSDLGKSFTPQQMENSLQKAYASFDEFVEKFKTDYSVKLACHEGCSICCYLRVDAKAHEILAIANFIASKFSPDVRTSTLDRLNSHAQLVHGLSYTEHMATNIVCPLLVDGRCSIYSMRPFGCRRHQSQRIDVCQHSFDYPKDLEYPSARHVPLFRMTLEVENSLQAIYSSADYDETGYELGTALLEALTNPKAWRRWKDHKKTFLQAVTAPAVLH